MSARTESLDDTVARIDDGSSIVTGLAPEHAIPFAVGHELPRQGYSNLT